MIRAVAIFDLKFYILPAAANTILTAALKLKSDLAVNYRQPKVTQNVKGTNCYGQPDADSTGAGFAGTPEGLARALDKLGRYSKKLPLNADPSTAHMFIVNPLSGRSLMSLFSTHPPLEERIARLRGNPKPSSPVSKSVEDPREARARAMWDRLSE